MQGITAPAVQIRQANPQDAQAIADLDKGAFGPDIAWPLDEFRSALADPNCDTQLALLGGRAVGYVLLRYQGPQVNVDSVAVSAEARGQKIGERLLLGGLERASARGCPEVTLQVEEGNAPAQKLYDKYGFVPTGPLPGYYNGKDGIQMTLKQLQSQEHQGFLAQRHQELLAGLKPFPRSSFTTEG